MSAAAASVYRVAPALAARLVGLVLALTGGLVFVTTLLVALAGLDTVVLLVVAILGVVGAVALAWWLGTRAVVVRLDDVGYRVRFVRGAGVAAARWADVLDADTRTVAGSPCVVLRLRDGRTTTVPVEVLAGDRDEFVRELQRRLMRGHGLRPL